MNNIVIYGAGGYGKEVACLIHAINAMKSIWNILGFIDDGLPVGESTPYGKVLGGLGVLNDWREKLYVVMAIGNPFMLKKIINKLSNTNLEFPNVISPDIRFYDLDLIGFGRGNILGFNCIISYNTTFGDFNILNSDVIIGHDVKIGSCNVFNPSVRISGNVTIGDANLFGVSSVILQNKRIGNNTIISSNSVVMRHTKDNSTYLGNPAIKMKF